MTGVTALSKPYLWHVGPRVSCGGAMSGVTALSLSLTLSSGLGPGILGSGSPRGAMSRVTSCSSSMRDSIRFRLLSIEKGLGCRAKISLGCRAKIGLGSRANKGLGCGAKNMFRLWSKRFLGLGAKQNLGCGARKSLGCRAKKICRLYSNKKV